MSFGDEYVNYRIEEQTGEFVNTIRALFEEFLIDIRTNCAITNYFVFDQTNRIVKLIIDKYHDEPEFPWDDSTEDGIFRNPNNAKWYALIMTINKNKLDGEDREVEVLNLKLDENKIPDLIKKKGFYRAYHMNKKKWITILLDDTVSDDEIMEYVTESHAFSESAHEWIIPANPKYYDVINCFNDTDTIRWKQSNNLTIGDTVYLYIASPYSAIFYKCKVVKVNIPHQYKDKNIKMSKVMEIKLVKRYKPDEFTFTKLNEYGIRAIRGPRYVPKELEKELSK